MQLGQSMRQGLEQRQQLSLNAEVLQSLEVLRLPIQELSEMLSERICENPLLELDAAPEAEAAQPPPPKEERQLGGLDDHSPDDAEPDMAVDYRDIWAGPAATEDFAADLGDEEQSFTEMLCEQVGALKLEAGFASLCLFLVHSLDRRGYFRDEPEELAALLGVTAFEVTQALYLVQSLQPAGVGARSLEECLLLQLVESRHFNQYTIRLVKNGLPLIEKGDLKAIARLLETSCDKAAEAVRIIRGLNPIPSQGYYTGEARQAVIPDAVVEKEPGGFRVVYNQRALPQLQLNSEYCGMLEKGAGGEAKDYLQQRLGEARQLIRAVGERKRTIERIISQIIGLQPAYFTDGLSLQPMTMAQVADALSLNVSTISRAVGGKYIVCAAGTVELRSLFSAGIQNQQGEAVSSGLIKRKIKEYIDAEEPASPLSDESIRQALQLVNITVSRRTVAKYREAMGIAGSSRRKRI